ncbi:DUF58 domain-containing protein [Alteromonas halophila]|uniref:DUF58 domain-containing protein n=1 Tax=Alteromonas halophila TaxID=516698 RepID=A0A918JDT9_9ALTE|nr:DUF58 domain-containing protein [Alteromonas halophila]GGW76067.1 DUF58 domain-containing protein [Alteromonas halophila]
MRWLRQRLSSRWQRWIDARIPAARQHSLNLKSIFIFPSIFGWGYLVMCVCLFLLGTNYQNNLMLFLCYFLAALMLVNLFTSYQNMAALKITSDPIKPVFAGQPATLVLEVASQNTKHPDINGLLNAHWLAESGVVHTDLDDGQWQLRLPYFTEQRGIVSLPRVTVFSNYPLGLFKCWSHLDFDQTLVIYPKLIPAPVRLESVSGEGDAQTEQTGYDDFYSLRKYELGEPLQRVAWKHVAKGGDWVSKAFSQQQSESGYLCLADGKNIETALSQLAYQIDNLTDKAVQFGLRLPDKVVPPASGAEHRHVCLSLLAVYPDEDRMPR